MASAIQTTFLKYFMEGSHVWPENQYVHHRTHQTRR